MYKLSTTIVILLLLTPLIFSLERKIAIPSNKVELDIDYCQLLNDALMFYKYNRAGRLPDNDVPWRGNSALKDASPGSQPDSNGDGDLSKGYFDAGDHVKFGFPLSGAMTMLGWGFLEYKEAIVNCSADSLYLEDLRWGYDWLMAAHISPNEFCAQVGNGEIDHAYWGPPELMTMDRPTYMINQTAPGTDLALEASAALSICYMIFKDTDETYAEKCLGHAKDLHNFGDTYRGVYSDSVTDAQNFYKSWSGYHDELVWGSIWLYKATGDKIMLTKAVQYYEMYNVGQMAQQNSHDWDLKAPGATLLLSQIFPGNETYIKDIEGFLNWWLPGGGVPYTPGGLSWIRQWAPCRYAMTTSFLMSVYGQSGDKYTSYTKSQLSYVLGNNPHKQSFVVGYGPNHPINPHHRASHHSLTDSIYNPVNNTYLILGSMVGGPAQDDTYVDDRTDYVKNEVALDYQAGFIGTISYLASISTNIQEL
ncbi:putative glycoside hydrolase [Tieghemostelium lacteum]|uniref:cellulase n=1 Tax=Tieghemostelium lacteum TaxID=361077 RepID=A0A152A8L6_TIELA|nr:putative glycoside hydrolase [Tieghemostelium lacteum]|eukprot:KYR02578.1 putative glycoside hydrolase [Tieghemostelium lacteum]